MAKYAQYPSAKARELLMRDDVPKPFKLTRYMSADHPGATDHQTGPKENHKSERRRAY